MQGRDELGGVVEGAYVVEFHLACRAGGLFGGGAPVAACGLGLGMLHSRGNDLPRAACGFRALQPAQQLLRIADGRGQADALDTAPGDPFETLQYGQQVPAPVVSREGVHLVDDDGAYGAQQARVVGLDADQHRFERLGRGQQDIRCFRADALPL